MGKMIFVWNVTNVIHFLVAINYIGASLVYNIIQGSYKCPIHGAT